MEYSLSDSRETDGIYGLSESEAASRLSRYGFNELPPSRSYGFWGTIVQVLSEPLFSLLLLAGFVYLLIGDVGEALMLLSFVFVVIGITIYQERKSSTALVALNALSGPLARVVRSGQLLRIPGREIVVGDTILLGDGDRIPGDAVLRSSTNLYIDESTLTGESIPVRKPPDARVFSGTLVVRGRGIAEVTAIGTETEIGKIGESISGQTSQPTRLQRETRVIVRQIMTAGILLCAAVVIIYVLTRGDWLHAILAGIALMMALLPEEYGVVLAVYMALGAWRIAKKHVLTRTPNAIENLGTATVLCVDKTGTLTLNEISVASLYQNGQTYELSEHPNRFLPETLHPILEYAILASDPDPFDPMETALKSVGSALLGGTEHLHREWSIVREYPLSEELIAMSNVWRASADSKYVVAAKGTPEAIVDLCHLRAEQRRIVLERVGEMGQKGLRVIGVARAFFTESEGLPRAQHVFDFEFLGLIGLEDPIRPSVPSAVEECRRAGMRVVMITGDYPDTAMSIARKIGLRNPDRVVCGDEIASMDEGELLRKASTCYVFARMTPQAKLRLVQAMKRNGEIVAMTGDGVNDAPALKTADIGIAMGRRGTDVAREAADLVLLDDDFSSLVAAVSMGRRIFDNIRKAMAYILAIHIPIAGLSLLPVLMVWPLILMPVHIVFLQLIIDPVCSIVFEAEPEEPGLMNRPPRPPQEKLLERRRVLLGIAEGTSVLVVVMLLFWQGRSLYGEQIARGMAFSAVVAANLSMILTHRSETGKALGRGVLQNPYLPAIILFAVGGLAVVLRLPFLTVLFDLRRLSWYEVAVSIGLGMFSVGWVSMLRRSR